MTTHFLDGCYNSDPGKKTLISFGVFLLEIPLYHHCPGNPDFQEKRINSHLIINHLPLEPKPIKCKG